MNTPLHLLMPRPATAAAVLLGLMSGLAYADTPPPIKTGLWEITTVSQQMNGQALPDMASQMAAQLKNMPPQMRQQIEAQMKAQGVEMSAGKSGGTAVRTCITQASLDQNRWQAAQGDCKSQITDRSGNTWKWKVSCTKPAGQGEGTTTFESPQAYTNQMRMTMSEQGRPQTMTMTHRAKWLSADCGGLKPMAPPSAK